MIVLQTHTRTLLDQAVANPPHALLLSGSAGAGKTFAAKYFATLCLRLEMLQDLDKYPYFQIIAPTNGTISIDRIRQLHEFLRLRTPGNQPIRRVAIIEDAHLMTTEAQNALLKSLEEPPADTVLILTAPATLGLKQTIHSRVRTIPILPITKEQAIELFGEDGPELDKAYAISGGLAGLLSAILHADDHQLLLEVQTAKKLLSSSLFERLAQVDELSKQKEAVPLFLQACKLICSAALGQAAAKQDDKKAHHWLSALQTVHRAEAALPRNPNTKLLLTDLLLRL